MAYQFDEEIPRKGTNSVKWEFIEAGGTELKIVPTDRFFGEHRTLPMWVADMDFRCPEAVVRALSARVEHGIYGYSAPTAAFYLSVVRWMERRHGWQIDPDWICITPGVVPALNMLVRTFVPPGGGVLIQPPVYHPFKMAIENNQAVEIRSPLRYADGRYQMDFTDLEAKVQDPAVTMAILCHPHNPVGRVWSEDELREFGRICAENDVLVVADEIHGDIVYQRHAFSPYLKSNPELARQTIVCTAPSKTFNLAGLQTSCIVIPNEELRDRFTKTLLATGIFGAGCFGLVALQAAYDEGEAWLEQVLAYLAANLAYLETYISDRIPQIEVVHPEGTYLVWLDCRKLGLDDQALHHLMLEEARIYLDDGFIFGPEGEGFQRINIACPRPLLAEALERLERAVAGS